MTQFDHLSSDKFWDLVYNTAKNKKRQKRLWKDLFSPEYADVIRDLATNHIDRINRELNDLKNSQGASETDSDVVAMLKARDFINKIRGQAIHAIEDHVARGRNIRKYAQLQDALDYSEYLKDTIEDLRTLIPEDRIDFVLHTSIEAFVAGEEETSIDDWLNARKARRG
jgi:spermidine/putrescine-binding protein